MKELPPIMTLLPIFVFPEIATLVPILQKFPILTLWAMDDPKKIKFPLPIKTLFEIIMPGSKIQPSPIILE